MKAYTTLYDDVLPELPGCEPAFALHHIKRTCNDFYERSLYSRDVLAGISVVAGTATYTVVPTDSVNFEVGKIISARLVDTANGGKPAKLYARHPAQLNIEMPDWDTQTGTPKFYTQRSIDSLALAYIPSQAYPSGLLVTIAKLPLYAGGGIDDAVYEKFAEAIGAGAKSRLMRMAKKPWTNQAMAVEYSKLFEQEVAAAGAIVSLGYGSAPLRSRAYG